MFSEFLNYQLFRTFPVAAIWDYFRRIYSPTLVSFWVGRRELVPSGSKACAVKIQSNLGGNSPKSPENNLFHVLDARLKYLQSGPFPYLMKEQWFYSHTLPTRFLSYLLKRKQTHVCSYTPPNKQSDQCKGYFQSLKTGTHFFVYLQTFCRCTCQHSPVIQGQ